MQMPDGTQRRDADGQAIVFDARWVSQVTPQWFDAAFWQAQARLRARAGGRGSIGYVDSPAGPLVLRHFYRGGLLGRLRGDRYLWLGAARSRGFREFLLLHRLHALGLPVPRVLGARCVRSWPWARADLHTAELPAAHTLAQRLLAGTLDAAQWPRIGAMLGRFHAAGVVHADLNAHNIVDSGGNWHLIDFDRGRVQRRAARAQQASLARLQRSLRKVVPDVCAAPTFTVQGWQPLLRAHAQALQANSARSQEVHP